LNLQPVTLDIRIDDTDLGHLLSFRETAHNKSHIEWTGFRIAMDGGPTWQEIINYRQIHGTTVMAGGRLGAGSLYAWDENPNNLYWPNHHGQLGVGIAGGQKATLRLAG
jgi:hypothetical protein